MLNVAVSLLIGCVLGVLSVRITALITPCAHHASPDIAADYQEAVAN